MNLSYSKNTISDEVWQKRISLLVGAVFLICLCLGYRLFDKTILEHSKYQALADNQHMVKRAVDSHRGKIFASDKKSDNPTKLAINIEEYILNIVPKNVIDKQETAKALSEIIDISETEIFDQINNDKLYVPPIKRRLNYQTAQKIIDLKLSGVLITPEDSRFYPEQMLASYILGFVNFDGQGKYGVEGFYDSELKGSAGAISGMKDTKGQIISVNSLSEGTNGADIYLTIDSNVQYMVEKAAREAKDKYQADSISILITNPTTGAIYAMGADTGYDPNKFNEVAKDNGQNAFNNPLISNAWEPGSIFKSIVMASAIDAGKVQPDTEGVFSNMTVVQGHEIHTAEDKAFGKETMTQVLENSDNVAMVWVADQLGNDEMSKYLQKFGLGVKSNIDLSAEASGNLPDVKQWRDINRATISFGQGVATTPLQIAMAYSAIVNGGKLLKPYVVDKIALADGREIKTEAKILNDNVISQDTSSKLKEMLISVVERGHSKKAKMDGYLVGGKTGTAQIADASGGYKENEYNHSFAGFFPANDPQFVIVVRVDNPKTAKYAESTAVPVFAELAKWLVGYYDILPSQ